MDYLVPGFMKESSKLNLYSLLAYFLYICMKVKDLNNIFTFPSSCVFASVPAFCSTPMYLPASHARCQLRNNPCFLSVSLIDAYWKILQPLALFNPNFVFPKEVISICV